MTQMRRTCVSSLFTVLKSDLIRTYASERLSANQEVVLLGVRRPRGGIISGQPFLEDAKLEALRLGEGWASAVC